MPQYFWQVVKKAEVFTDSAQLKLAGTSLILSGVGHPLLVVVW